MTDMARPDGAPRIPGCTDVEPVRSGLPRTYRCRREGTGEPVIALVYPARVDSGTATEFTRQVAALGSVEDPRVAPVLDAGLADGLPYVLTTPDAGTLAELIDHRLRSPAELADLGRDLASGLAAVHAAGLVHGGLTPDTVAVAPGGGHQLSGLTLGLEQHTGHTALSSPRQLYLAPETLRNGTMTPMSDLYALGTVLYTAVSGRPPLAARMGETAGDHILRVLHEPPARIDALPDPFADLVARLLEKDPARRPRDAEAVAGTLAELASGPSASADGGGPLPLVRPVADPPSSSTDPSAPEAPVPARPTGSADATGPTTAVGPADVPEPADATGSAAATGAADAPAVPALPRPALMNRGRPFSVRASTPPTEAGTEDASRVPADVPPARPEQPSDEGPATSGSGFDRRSRPRTPDSPDPRPTPGSTPGPSPHEPSDSEEPPAGPDHDRITEPVPRRRRTWLLPSAGVALAATLIAVLAFASRQGQDPNPEHQPPPRADQRSSDPASEPKRNLDVRLNPPVDHDTYIDLSWTGDPGLEYAVVIAQVGKSTDLKLVYDKTKYRVPVIPGVKYCFAVQATDGIQTFETEPWPIRDAECEL